MDNSLKRARNLVALEAYTVPDLTGLVQRVFPTILDGISSFKGLFTPAPAVSITGDQKRFLKSLEGHSYANLMPIGAFVPEGMKETYLEYIAALHPAVQHVSKSVKVLDDFAVFLAMIMTNKSSLTETATKKKFYAELQAERERLIKGIQDCFNNSTKTDVRVENVVKRNGDWDNVLKTTEEMTKEINKIERSHLNKKVDECTEMLNRISQRIHEGHFDKVSPAILIDLSDGAFQVASELEFYSIVYYRVLGLSEAISRTIKHIEKSTSLEGVKA